VLTTLAFCVASVFCGVHDSAAGSTASNSPQDRSAREIPAVALNPPDAKTVPPKFVVYPVEEQILQATNAQRANYGLPPLEMDPWLMDSARRHAAWMTNSRNMVHSNQALAENIAMGQPNAPSVLQTWMNSSGHRANILNPGHRRIGVAAYQAPEGTIYWCQQFLP